MTANIIWKCLRTLEPAEVLQHIHTGATVVAPRQPAPAQRNPHLDLVYYGEVFNASGYGAAARAYIHALHGAGIKISVVNTGGPPAGVRDSLVESLLGNSRTADFHLFHGIPTTWAQQAFRCSNAIGMTVWETDTMPTQWASTLNHVMEVWLRPAITTSPLSSVGSLGLCLSCLMYFVPLQHSFRARTKRASCSASNPTIS